MIRSFAAVLAFASLLGGLCAQAVVVGSRVEPFVDEYLIASKSGVEFLVQRPEPQKVVLVTDRPWEGNTSAYYTVFRDGKKFKMYYRGSHYDEKSKKATHREVTCYAESADGIHWMKPELGLFEFDGSKANNIVWDGIGTHCFAVFKDGNPNCKPDAPYKAIARGRPKGKKGLYVFRSRDGIRWSLMHDTPVITEGYFDSQNLAFWDPRIGAYREYHRTFVGGVRAIMTATSRDFLTWTAPVLVSYGDAPNDHLYTNAIMVYPGAPHLLIGFPTRYLPKQKQRVEPLFMASRDGLRFRRYASPLIPEDAPADRGGNRSNYMAWGMVMLPGRPEEFSVYATEAYYTGPDSRLRRFTFRRDRLVAMHAGPIPGSVSTRLLKFTGARLMLNSKTASKGSIRCGFLGDDGKPIPGLSIDECEPVRGDDLDRVVSWKGGADIGRLAGRAVSLQIGLVEADVFSIRFQ